MPGSRLISLKQAIDGPVRLIGRRAGTARNVIVAGLLLVCAQVAYRGSALYGSWFYLDDYNLLLTATQSRLDAAYLLEPYNSHLMPGGRLLAWLVADSGSLNWTLAATLVLILQAVAGVAALWMLATLFTARWEILAPLSLYLFSALTLPAMMWWTAALNQVFLQAAFFLAVGAWVRYLRTKRVTWLAATALALALGLAFYVKVLLIFAVLVYLALVYFASGSPVRRLVSTVRTYWPAVVSCGALAGVYLGYYLANVRQPLTGSSAALIAKIADTMLSTAFATAAVGGPWRWATLAPPNSFADPPSWAVNLAWVLIALVVAYVALRRRGTGRAWVLLGLYLFGLLGLLVNSRAPVYGEVIGLEYRYLTDAACALALCLALAFLELPGAAGSSAPRDQPLLSARIPTAAVIALVVAVSGSGVVSSWRYATVWHNQNASDAYLHNLRDSLSSYGAVELVNTGAPDSVIPGIFAPDNTIDLLTPLVSDKVTFPAVSSRLATIGPAGDLRRTEIQPGVVSENGPKQDCGWLVRERGRTIPLTNTAFEWVWWVHIGYLAGRDSELTVIADGRSYPVEIDAGLNDLYLRVEGSFDSLRFEDLDPGATMCVDTIEVGQPVPGGPL